MLSLSVIIPAYNEEHRIKPFLDELLEFKENAPFFKELIVVNDGSTDNTVGFLQGYGKSLRILSYAKNRGKGYAVKQGILAATQNAIVFMDADGSTPANELSKMVRALEKYEFVTGTRADRASNITNPQPFQRKFAGLVFNLMARVIFRTGIKDSLCGFKGFRKEFGKKVAGMLISERWVFDVEMFARAKKMGVKIGVIPIVWKHVGEAKMTLGWTNVKMTMDLVKLKIALMRERPS